MSEPVRRPDAALWRRLVARLIDAVSVFAFLFAFVVVRLFWFMDSWSNRFDPDPWGRAFVATVTFVVMFAAYEAVFVGLRGQTPGKDQMNVKVVRTDSEEAPGIPITFLRWLLPGLLCLVTPIWLAATFVLLLGVTALLPGRRAVHDLIAGTRVVVYDSDIEEESPYEPTDREEFRKKYGSRSFLESAIDSLLKPRRQSDD